MEKLEKYRSIIEKLLTEYYTQSIAQPTTKKNTEVSDRLILDPQRNHYLWLRFGWEDKKKIQYIILYLCLKNGKIWVEEDTTDLYVVDDLLAAGIPQSDIVLGFHHPSKRPLTEFALA